MSGDVASRGWRHLPAEIRYQILGYLPLLGVRASLLAPVCRDWQSMIEPHNFARIVLTIPHLADTNSQKILFRKRHYIRCIMFSVELRKYNEASNNPGPDRTIMYAFKRLFTALSAWEPRGDLVLGIIVDFPAYEQWSITKYPRLFSDTSLEARSPLPYTMEKINNDIIDLGPFPDEESEMEWWRGLPLVPAVGVVLLQQRLSNLEWDPVALSSMFTRFPNMKELGYETWGERTHEPSYTDKRLGAMVEAFSVTKLCKLAISPKGYIGWPSDEREPNPVLGKKLARASLLLTTLSASFKVDAGEFFAARQETWLWERLTSLVLTSRVLHHHAEPEEVSHMLGAAAAAALSMPRLDTMVLWNAGRGLAMLFRYQKAQDGRSAVITVRGTSELPLGAAVTRAWESVARRHRHGELIIQTSSIDPNEVRGYGEAILQLGLPAGLVQPM